MRFFGLGSKNSHAKPPSSSSSSSSSSASSSIKTVSSSSSLSEQSASAVSIQKHYGVVPVITIVEPDQSDRITSERKNTADNSIYKKHSRERQQKSKYTPPLLVRPPRSIAETLAHADGLMAYRSRPVSTASSLRSGTHSIPRPTTVARGFHEAVAALPDPIPINSSVKLVLGHGKDGSRPAFSLASQRKSSRHRRHTRRSGENDSSL